MSQREKMDLSVRIGQRIRLLREETGLSGKDLAAAAGISAPFLSRVENGKTMPSIPTLQSLAEVLKVDMASLLSQSEQGSFTISRKSERRSFYSLRGSDKRVCYRMAYLADNMPDAIMDPALVTDLMRSEDELELSVHGGQEFCYVVRGSIELILGSQRFVLEEGDAAYWDGRIPHGAISRGDPPAETLNIHVIPGTRTGTFQTNGINSQKGGESEAE